MHGHGSVRAVGGDARGAGASQGRSIGSDRRGGCGARVRGLRREGGDDDPLGRAAAEGQGSREGRRRAGEGAALRRDEGRQGRRTRLRRPPHRADARAEAADRGRQRRQGATHRDSRVRRTPSVPAAGRVLRTVPGQGPDGRPAAAPRHPARRRRNVDGAGDGRRGAQGACDPRAGRSEVTPALRVATWSTAAAVCVTGLVYGWMLYCVSPEDPMDLANHPWQPTMLYLHVLAAPVWLVVFGVLWQAHALPKLQSPEAARRRSGITLIVLSIAMAASGYLLQTS